MVRQIPCLSVLSLRCLAQKLNTSLLFPMPQPSYESLHFRAFQFHRTMHRRLIPKAVNSPKPENCAFTLRELWQEFEIHVVAIELSWIPVKPALPQGGHSNEGNASSTLATTSNSVAQ